MNTQNGLPQVPQIVKAVVAELEAELVFVFGVKAAMALVTG